MIYKISKPNNISFITVFLLSNILFLGILFVYRDLLFSFTRLIFVFGIIDIPLIYAWISKNILNIEINNNNLSYKFLSYILWSVPISSITHIGYNMVSSFQNLFYNNYLNGFIIKTHNKLYKIPYDLENEMDFIKDIQSKNSNIIIMNDPYKFNYLTGASNKITSEYKHSKELRNLLVIVLLIVLFLAILFLLI